MKGLHEALAGRGAHTRVAGVVRGGERTIGAVAPPGAPEAGPDTLFEIGSVTKVLTATLLAEMHLRGEVGLDDPLDRHLPPEAGPAWRHRPPTLAELATHRSGLPNTPRPMARKELLAVAGVLRGDPWAGVDDARYRALLRATSPRRAPGASVGYSSVGFGLLGDALARAAGTSYEALLRERVCVPLGMPDTWIEVPPGPRERLLVGRSRRGAPRPPLRDAMPAAGSVRSTAADMLTFLEACLEPPVGPLGAAIALAQAPRERLARRMSVGLGWLVLRRREDPPVVWHNGGTWGFRSFAGLVPGEGRAVVVLADTAVGVDRVGFELLERS